jgi:hypothetical protein
MSVYYQPGEGHTQVDGHHSLAEWGATFSRAACIRVQIRRRTMPFDYKRDNRHTGMDGFPPDNDCGCWDCAAMGCGMGVIPDDNSCQENCRICNPKEK